MTDPSDNVCIETLRPKSVPDGLIALGVVVQVTDLQVKLQIPGGVVVLVDREGVSSVYTDLWRNHTGVTEPLRLSKLFNRGQQYVCKILEKRPRKGYADAKDIIATLDPSALQEDVVAKALLAIPQVPLQAAVKSIEDHGYQIDIGFQNLTGFLSFEAAKGKKFAIGQVIRCNSEVSTPLDDDCRVVQLSLKKSKFSQEKVSKNVITERCILPGSKSFCTVMKVQNEGLVVNFMNEFAGFVASNNLKEDSHTPKGNYKISNQLDCTVLYYNHITKTFALSLRSKSDYKRTLEHFLENYHVGQVIKKAKFLSLIGTRTVRFKVDKKFKAVANVNDALDEDLNTMTRDEMLLKLDSSFSEGSTHKCRIKSINYSDLILVLSLRREFLELPYVSVDELKPADFIEVEVKKHVKDGIVVTFGLNLKAIILNVDLHDYVSSKSYKRYPIGKKIKCRVLKVDMTKQPPRVYLTDKEQLMNLPLASVISSCDGKLKGRSTQAVVAKVGLKGLIVEFFNNVKGFIPRRFLSSIPIKDPNDLFKVGQVISCTVYRADAKRQSLLLGVLDYEKIVRILKEKKERKKKKKELKELSKIDTKLERVSQSSNKKRKADVYLGTSNVTSGQVSSDAGQGTFKRPKCLDIDLGINWSAGPENISTEYTRSFGITKDEGSEDDGSESSSSDDSRLEHRIENAQATNIKTRRQRSEEARLREEKLRETENRLMDPDRPPQSIPDFERLVLKTPNSADAWIKYSKFFLENVETEKSRIICRRALEKISFRLEKEKLKVWLHLIKIEAKYGGAENLNRTVEEAKQTNDHLSLYRGIAKVLVNCDHLEEAEKFHELLLRTNNKTPDVWVEYIQFLMEHKKDLEKARDLFNRATRILLKSDQVILKSRFGQIEFKFGDVERGKTVFENLLSDNPKRTDLWKVYEGMVRKYGTRQSDTEDIREQNNALLARISESIDLVSKKKSKKSS